jgi:hypothetical protein
MADKVLEKLSLPHAAQPVTAKRAEVSAPKVDDRKLSSLTQPTAPTPQPESAAPKIEAAKPVDLSKADEKLSSLLGGKK